MTFENLNLIDPIMRALKNEGYVKPTPIQEKAIPVILGNKDMLGNAQTGTGKTAAFALPILQILSKEQKTGGFKRAIKSLILTPTRELAIQTGENFTAYGRYTGLRHAVIYGGVSQRAQTDKLRAGVDILIATTGRLLDLMNQKYVNLDNIKIFVLDEADRMLDMGFIDDIKKIIKKIPGKRQTLLFSATMPSEISELADNLLKEPVKIAVDPVSSPVETIKQSVFMVKKDDKKSLLIHLLKNNNIDSALVFTRTKHGADKVAKIILRAGIKADAIHGDKTQNARQKALNNFKSRQIRVLIATDIASRGIDIDEISHVINYDMPDVPETYIHRIGRTGRAGLSGIAMSFCSEDERGSLKDINKFIAKPLPITEDHPFHVSFTTGIIDFDKNKKKHNGKKPFYGYFKNKKSFKKRGKFNPALKTAVANPKYNVSFQQS